MCCFSALIHNSLDPVAPDARCLAPLVAILVFAPHFASTEFVSYPPVVTLGTLLFLLLLNTGFPTAPVPGPPAAPTSVLVHVQ